MSKKKISFLLLIMAMVIAIGHMAFYAYEHGLLHKLTARAGVDKKALYRCPMHPNYISDKPGDCPICGMRLIPFEEPQKSRGSEQHPGHIGGEEKAGGREGHARPGTQEVGGEESPPGTVMITPEKQQLIGVKFGEVKYLPLSKIIRTVGRVTYNETKIARVHTKIDGWIEKVFVDFTGKLVRKGDPLISIYSPELVSTQQEYLLALKAKKYLSDNPIKEISSGADSLYEATKKRLLLWDVTENQVRELESRGTPAKAVTLYSPIDGFVLTRNAFEKQRITPDTELYAIADLSTIWVLADIYEYEVPMIKLGQTATMTLPYFPGETFKGKVTYIYPQLDNMTRTLKARLEFENHEIKLKPDMYANVELRIDYGHQLAVPEDAVLSSGTENIVFVAKEGGYFEPRPVVLGQKVGDLYIVLKGLKAGEKIVTSGNFLIDSESRLKAAVGAMAGHEHSVK